MGALSKLLPDIGAMDQLISIKQYSSAADATGDYPETGSYLAEDIWANVAYTAQSDEGMRGEDQQIVAWNRVKFTFRDFWTITNRMRVVFEEEEYDILNINRLGRSRFVVIEAEKRDNLT